MRKLLQILGLVALGGLLAACSASLGATFSVGQKKPSGVTVAEPSPSPSPSPDTGGSK